MWLALLKKELAETYFFGLLGMVVLLVCVATEMDITFFVSLPIWSLFGIRPEGITSIPFLDTKLHAPLAMVGGVLTAIIAARQIFFEDQRKTFNLLLHLPLPRSTIFLTKMLAALIVYFVAMTIPVLVFALWAAIPGHHASPFFWWMVWIPFRLILCLPILYFGWLLTWLRPASWFGTRLLPLVTAVALTFLWGAILTWWSWGVVLVILTEVLLAISILWVAEERNY